MKARKVEGRVDVLLSRLLDAAVSQSKDPTMKLLHAGAKPGVDLLLKEKVGPRTKRGKQISATLYELREAWERMQAKQREIGQGQRV